MNRPLHRTPSAPTAPAASRTHGAHGRARATRGVLAALAAWLALVASPVAPPVHAQTSQTAQPAQAPGAAPAGAAPAAGGTTGVPAAKTAATPEMTARMQKLAAELRCLVCQNQTLADSHAELAVELRREVESMMLRGDSDAQIKDYLVQRYGDFVLYRPPVQGNTALLWFGPFALLLVGAVVWLVVQRRSRRTAAAQDAGIAETQRERAKHLLEE